MKEINQISFFIGSNNDTKKPEYQKAINVFSKYFTGFNLNKNVLGYWNGKPEKCFNVVVLDIDGTATAKTESAKLELERELKQEMVLTRR